MTEEIKHTPLPFPKDGSIFVTESIDRTVYRWAKYKPQGAKQMGKPGRWQKQVWHGDYFKWENCEEPSGEIAPATGDGPITKAFKDRALITSQSAEIERLREANEWKPISTCPMQEPVDLWCVYGSEEFARFDGGASIGRLVSSRFKHPEYGFFGNQSNEGVPRRDGVDLVPVAWRKAVPQCPAELIAEVMGIALTFEDATALETRS